LAEPVHQEALQCFKLAVSLQQEVMQIFKPAEPAAGASLGPLRCQAWADAVVGLGHFRCRPRAAEVPGLGRYRASPGPLRCRAWAAAGWERCLPAAAAGKSSWGGSRY